MQIACRTDIGRQSSTNEDAVTCKRLSDGSAAGLLAVADGVGGAPGGDQASETAIDAAVRSLSEDPERTIRNPSRSLEDAFHDAHDAVQREVHEQAGLAEAGTTLVIAIVPEHEDLAYIGNVGDSRAYSLTADDEPNGLIQVTTDQSLVQELVEEGEVEPAEAEDHPMSNVITQAIGTADELEVDIYLENDINRLLLCSDGLPDVVSQDEMERLLDSGEAEYCCDQLIEAANEAGGPDNISVGIYISQN